MQKRATFTTLAAAGPECEEMDGRPGSSKKSAEKKKKKSDQPIRTIRLQVDLQQPTKETFAELNYDELIRKAGRSARTDDPSKKLFDEENNDDEDVARLARSFEEKYGNKKRRSGWEDYVDKGMGYDETDPFIDNDEAYDELIPSSLTTKYGGFYVNTGPLDFKPAPVCEQPDDSCDKVTGGTSPRAPVVKRRKSANSTAGAACGSGHNNGNVKKKKKDHQPEQRTVAQMIDQKRLNRDRGSPDEPFLQPARKSRPVIEDEDDEDQETGNADAPCSQSVIDVIECVARGRANGTPIHKQPQQPTTLTEKQSVIRMVTEGAKMEGLAMNSLARMVSVAGRSDGDRQPQNNGQPQQQRSWPTDLSQHSSRPPDAVSPSPGFKQHPGLVDQPLKPPSGSSLLSRSPATGFAHSVHNKAAYDRSPGSMRMQQQQQQSPADPQTKQSPTSAQIRSSFQSVIKTGVDSKKGSESPTMDSLMEKVISNSLQKFPNSSSSPFSLPSPTSLQAKNFKTPPAAHQQPKNSFTSPFLDPSIRGRSHLDTMILEHLNNNEQKGPSPKVKSESPQPVPTDSTSHAKVVKIKDQYRIPNLPVGPKLHHSSSSSRPNSLPSLSSGKQSQPLPQHYQQQQQQQHRGQKTSPPAVSAAPSGAGSSSQQKVSQQKGVHANRSSSSHARQSPHAPDSISPFSPVIQPPLWNPMAMYHMFDTSLLTSHNQPNSMAGLSAALSRPGIPVSQGSSNLPPDQFLSMHSYAAPPGGKGETGS